MALTTTKSAPRRFAAARATIALALALGFALVPAATAYAAAPASSAPAPRGDEGAPAAAAVAAPPAAGAGDAAGSASPTATVTPPEPVEAIAIPYPTAAPPRTGPAVVQVLITIGADGTVREVKLVEGAGEPFDSAVADALKKVRFRPATLNGKPVDVAVPFTQTFLPPSSAAAATAGDAPALDAMLEGFIVERGTRRAVGAATVAVSDSKGERLVATDAQGHFEIGVASGEVRVQVVNTGLKRFVRVESLAANQRLKVKYLVERESYDPYHTVVVGTRERLEVSRTTLEGREIHQLPGTFGDPFRVVNVLPGVTQPMSLLPLPVVRGSSPGDTGIFLDGVRLPLLFHLFAGPSVIHPEFVDKVDFYPGGFPVSYGGYTAGIIDGRTARPREGEDRLDFDLNLLQSGAFVREGVPDTSLTATVAARYGYPGLIISALTPDLSLAYWDYQARLDGGARDANWTVFFFGASDTVKAREPGSSGPLQTQAALLFHRMDLRARLGDDERNGSYRFIVGYDKSQFMGDTASTRAYFLEPQASWLTPLGSTLRLHTGLEVTVRKVETPPLAAGLASQMADALQPSGVMTTTGAYVETPWKPVESLVLVPGVRGDVYTQTGASQWSIDPRFTVRWRPGASDGLWLKGMIGRYHQPPRVFMPVPGADQGSLKLGLLASTQTGAGFEAKVAPGVELNVDGYYNDMYPVVFDFQTNAALSQVQPSGPNSLPGEIPTTTPPSNASTTLDRLFTKRTGHAYGLEVMLRKRDTSSLFGWLAYTLSHSTRSYDTGWAPFDYDRTHIFNAVAGIRLPRNWEIGGRLLLQSGTPLTTIYGYNEARADWQYRFDLRIDKRAVWNKWMLDFYIDVVNSTVAAESGGLIGSFSTRYVLPTVGFRAVL